MELLEHGAMFMPLCSSWYVAAIAKPLAESIRSKSGTWFTGSKARFSSAAPCSDTDGDPDGFCTV
jgi:hypothetical protein